jgi:small subunit ribosomal protein S17
MSNIWNFKDPLKCGFVKLAHSGREKFGTVIKSGFMRKTVTVKSDSLTFNHTYGIYLNRPSKFQVHDEDEICKTGDKVVIRVCRPISKLKHYYIRNIVWMVPRQNFTLNKFLNFEKRALLFNEGVRNTSDILEFNATDRV